MAKVSFEYKGEQVEANVIDHVSSGFERGYANMVLQNSFDENGEYIPSVRWWVENRVILAMYTDIDFDKYNDADEWLNIFDKTDFMDQVEDQINWCQLSRFRRSIQRLIDIRINAHPFKGLGKLVKDFISQNAELLQSIASDETVKKQIEEFAKTKDGKEFVDAVAKVMTALSANS